MEPKTKVEAVQRNEIVTPYQLLTLAIETKADPDRLDKLMDLQIKWEANKAKKAYVEAMAVFRSKCPMIEKTRSVDFPGKSGGSVRYKYAGLSEIIEQTKGLMSECGLSHSWRTSQANGSISVRCIVTHIEGHSEETSLLALPDNTGSKNSIQAIASTVSYLERYTLFALLGLASQEMDNDGDTGGEQRKPAEYKPPTEPATKPVDKESIKAANKTLVDNAFFEYQTVHAADMPDGKIFSLKLFEAEFRAAFKGLAAAQKKAFKWEQDSVNKLAETILPANCLTDIEVAPDA